MNRSMNNGYQFELAYDIKSEPADYNNTASNMIFSPNNTNTYGDGELKMDFYDPDAPSQKSNREIN